MKTNPKKLLLMMVLAVILIALFIMIGQRNLKGELVCLVATGVLFIFTQTRHHPNTKP